MPFKHDYKTDEFADTAAQYDDLSPQIGCLIQLS